MLTKLMKRKVFRDPLYGYVSIDYKLISDLIDTKEFQRLRRIRQLSGVGAVFHTAEHSRFGHSLGVYELSRRILERVPDVVAHLTEQEQVIFLASALLHDIGHGPYSHSFEHVFGFDHEAWSASIVTGDTEVNAILKACEPQLPTAIASVIRKEGKYPLIEDLVSSQLDVDRLDYLERDAYFTGAAYGRIELDRILRMMTVHKNKIVFKSNAVHAIENYLMSRYHMYWQVYYHPTARSYEIILEKIYVRVTDLILDNYDFKADVSLLQHVMHTQDLSAYVAIDDTYINGIIKQFCQDKDYILADLANDFMNRRLFAYVEESSMTKTLANTIRELANKDPLFKRYYCKEDQVSQTLYVHDEHGLDISQINVITNEGNVENVAAFSPIVRGLTAHSQKTDCKLFYKEAYLNEKNNHSKNER